MKSCLKFWKINIKSGKKNAKHIFFETIYNYYPSTPPKEKKYPQLLETQLKFESIMVPHSMEYNSE